MSDWQLCKLHPHHILKWYFFKSQHSQEETGVIGATVKSKQNPQQ